MGAPYFLQIQDRNTRANFCKKYFSSSNHQNDNGAVATRNLFVQCKRNQQLHRIKKYDIVEYNTLWTVQLCYYFSILIKLKVFRVTRNKIPKLVKIVRLYQQVVTFFCRTRLKWLGTTSWCWDASRADWPSDYRQHYFGSPPVTGGGGGSLPTSMIQRGGRLRWTLWKLWLTSSQMTLPTPEP